MDEPFGALDALTRHALQQEMTRIHRDSGKTIVFVTHDIDEALRLATRVVLLDQGNLVQVGSPAQLLTQPASAFVSEFIGRDDLGLRLLGLHTVADRVRAGDDAAGPAVPTDMNLRDALSLFVVRGVDRLAVVNAQGHAAGALHFADLLPRREP
jgi:osmoprotectant transport system ATP-binding protein